ncbi:DUF6482 family protein [Halopseudomonas sp.]|uniref:DUF6482 family protein n=1 Tax=Halopseudomonas sp. TaxID=2901191 RepID=UPI00311EC275
MTLDQLQLAAEQGRLERLALLSHEGSLYLVEAQIDGRRALLHDDVRQGPWHFRSLEDVRRALRELPWPTIELVHLNVADEAGATGPVAGSADEAAMRLTVPLRP